MGLNFKEVNIPSNELTIKYLFAILSASVNFRVSSMFISKSLLD